MKSPRLTYQSVVVLVVWFGVRKTLLSLDRFDCDSVIIRAGFDVDDLATERLEKFVDVGPVWLIFKVPFDLPYVLGSAIRTEFPVIDRTFVAAFVAIFLTEEVVTAHTMNFWNIDIRVWAKEFPMWKATLKALGESA